MVLKNHPKTGLFLSQRPGFQYIVPPPRFGRRPISLNMREIGQLPNEQAATQFADFLLASGMKAELRRGQDGSVSVWLLDETRLADARRHLADYIQNPAAPQFAAAAKQARAIRKVESRLDRDYARRVTEAGSVYDSGRYLRGTPVVKLLIAISIGVSLWTNFGKKTNLVVDYINLTTPRYDNDHGWVLDSLSDALGREPWRLVAPMFLHMGFIHLFFNMSWLAGLGGLIEREKNSRTLLGIVLVTHIVAAFTEYFWDIYGLHRHVVLFGGFSGAVYGLIGYAWMYGEYNRGGFIGLSSQNIQLAVIWMILCFSGAMGPVANGAHFGGLAAGMCLGIVSGLRDSRRR